MNVKDAYVIAHMNPNEDMPDYLTDEDQIPMRFPTKEEAEVFIWSIAPADFDLENSSIKIYRVQ